MWFGGYDMHAVIETPGYLRAAHDEGMTAEEMDIAVETVSRNPLAGDLVVGGGGCRKIRIAGKGHGKSGGYRILTYYANLETPVFLLSVLSKGARANFSKAQIGLLAQVTKKLKASLTGGAG
jgi:hypothetical protein